MSFSAPTRYAKSVRILSNTAVKKILRIDSAKKARIVQFRTFSENGRQTEPTMASKTKIPMVPIFLRFLGIDIEQNPHRLQPVTTDLLARINDLVGDEDIDLDAPLLPEDDD